jgi:regulatory protein
MPQALFITSIVVQQRNHARCSVFVNGEFSFGCAIDVAERNGLRKGQELSRADIERMQTEDDALRVKQAAYKYVSYKPRTARQVRQKMREKGFTTEEAEQAIEFLMDLGHIDDVDYARMFIGDTLKRKAVGLDKIRMELKKRGVSDDDIEDVLAQHFDHAALHDQTQTNIYTAARKKLSTLQRKYPSDPHKRKQALVTHLQRQGFAWHDIKPVVEDVLADASTDKTSDGISDE